MLSIVIPSKDAGNLISCLAAIKQHDPGYHIVVVDDGLSAKPVDVALIPGAKPFIFARNANLGLEHAFAAGSDAAILMNDDALLETRRGFTAMYKASKVNTDYGLISACTNNTGNPNQYRHEGGDALSVRREHRMLCFICVLIPVSTWRKVGPLDEAFTGYGFEDDAYSLSVRRAGLKLGIYDGCFVDHAKLHSSFRAKEYPVEGFNKNHQLFLRKYGGHK